MRGGSIDGSLWMTDKRWGDGAPLARHGLAEPWGVEPSERWVRVMAEDGAPGLWDVTGCARDAEELPIDSALVARMEAWAEWYDRESAANVGFPKSFHWEQLPDAPVTAFNAEGRAIGRAIHAALPNWTVVIVDVDAWCRSRDARDADDTELILRRGE